MKSNRQILELLATTAGFISGVRVLPHRRMEGN